MKNYPILYKKSKNNKISQWEVWVDIEDSIPVIYRKSGFIGFKNRTNRRFIKKGTNIGKKNEKTAYENACFIANNYWKKHIEDNYVSDINDVDKPHKYLKPMLAKPYKHRTDYVLVQPKYNGIRGVSFRHINDNRLISRERKEFSAVKHITNSLNIFKEYSPDGEIYNHNLTFQEIVRRTKKYRENLTEELQYYVYDLAIPNVSFVDRLNILNTIIPINHPIIKIAPCFIANSDKEVKEYHNKFVNEGYEGVIVREPDSEYMFNDRPFCLMKYKEFIDEEFIVVDYEKEEWDDNGVIKNLVIWICETNDKKRFSVRPKGSFERRIEYYNNAESYIGLPLTGRYQELSEDGTPIFCVGIEFRNYE
jgi:DNA ligase-1